MLMLYITERNVTKYELMLIKKHKITEPTFFYTIPTILYCITL